MNPAPSCRSSMTMRSKRHTTMKCPTRSGTRMSKRPPPTKVTSTLPRTRCWPSLMWCPSYCLSRVLLPIVALRFIYQITLGVDALAREEEHEAFLHFMGAIAHVTDGASDFAGSSVFARAIRQRVKPPAATLQSRRGMREARQRPASENGRGLWRRCV